ncbi:alkaline phosphatase D family protein [Bdellovibrio sp. KM01]|uniref:alkaline phosphatase D family protein n=1 Tax=Bdellovibrio sp. KM01 TaxID=2748865 RepID=UPI0015E94D0B|nr:alkaline phosphatase D family protein [Bdellovibrio sp. KM01]QLY26275.1 alkaline phosphatase family protein [Bdellovibrio sp. KM01]
MKFIKANLPRRKFLQYLAALAPAAWVAKAQAQALTANESGDVAEAALDLERQLAAGRRIPMLQTWADETSALVVVMGPKSLTFDSQNNTGLSVQLLRADDLGSQFTLYRLQVTGLSPTAYSQIGVYNQSRLVDVRSLKGLDMNQASPNLAVASCANFRKTEGQEYIYPRFHEAKTDAIFFIGDIVYSNSRVGSVFKTPEEPSSALARYVETWRTVDLYQMEPLVPTLAMWDDHDYGQNNGDATNPYRDQMKAIFRSFYPMPETHERLSYGPGVAFRLRAFGIDFHFLDDRSFLVNQVTQWGEQQEDWFFKDYLASSNPAWIMNGVQFVQYAPVGESVQRGGLPSLQRLRNVIKANMKPVVFVTGDVHYSQIQYLSKDFFGLNTYELTSSAIHSSSVGEWLRRSQEVGQLFYYGESNFFIVKPQVAAKAMELDVSCATATGIYPTVSAPLRIET